MFLTDIRSTHRRTFSVRRRPWELMTAPTARLPKVGWTAATAPTELWVAGPLALRSMALAVRAKPSRLWLVTAATASSSRPLADTATDWATRISDAQQTVQQHTQRRYQPGRQQQPWWTCALVVPGESLSAKRWRRFSVGAGAGTNSHNRADGYNPDFWWTNGIGDSTTGYYATETGLAAFHDTPTTWRFTTTGGGAIASNVAAGQWVTMEVRYDFTNTQLSAIHNLWAINPATGAPTALFGQLHDSGRKYVPESHVRWYSRRSAV